jgi:hypothetical protein
MSEAGERAGDGMHDEGEPADPHRRGGRQIERGGAGLRHAALRVRPQPDVRGNEDRRHQQKSDEGPSHDLILPVFEIGTRA